MAAGGNNNGSSSGGGTATGSGGHSHGHRRQESMYAMTGLYSESTSNEEDLNESSATATTNVGSSAPCCHDAVVKCHSRNPSAGIADRWVSRQNRGSSVGIATSYGLDDRESEFESRYCQEFSSRSALGSTRPPIQRLPEALSRG
jgi:hypothetical protein